MATFSSNIRNGTGIFKLELRQKSQSISSNTSTVSYKLYIQGKNGYGFWNKFNSGKTDIYIDGKRIHYQTGRNFDLRGGGTQQLASGTTTVKHKEDGTKSFKFSASLWSTSATGSLSGSFTLSKIPRSSNFRFTNSSGAKINEITVNNKPNIVIDKKVSSFSHTVRYKINEDEIILANKTSSTNITWDYNTNDIVPKYMANVRSLSVDFYVDTYDGSNKIGTTKNTLNLKVDYKYAPVIGTVEFSEKNTNKINVIGTSPYYQSLTDLGVNIYTYGQLGSSIKSVNVTLGNNSKTGKDVIFYGPNLKGRQVVKIIVTDSRGLSSRKEKTVEFEPYKLPNIAVFDAYRNQTNSRFGKARIKLDSTVIGSKNPLDVKVDISEKDTNYWTNVYSATVGNGYYNGEIDLGEIAEFKAYDVRARISDKFKSHKALTVIPSSTPSLVLGANNPAVGIGTVPEISRGLEVKGLLKIRDCFISDSGDDLTIRHVTSGSIKLLNPVKIKGDIKPYLDQNREYNVDLNDMTGYIKCTKDPLSNVHIWGKVKITGTYPTGRWNVWGKIPKTWAPRVTMPLPSTNGSRTVDGLAITADGVITWIAQLNNSYSPSVEDSFEMDYIYRAGDGDW